MAISRKPRHWIALVIALALTVVALIQFADFSGEPAPRWREVALAVLAPLCLASMLLNLVLDGKSARDG